MDTIQAYQLAKARHRETELNITKAKTQVEVYKNEIANILASEQVASLEDLALKYQATQEELKAVTDVLNRETEAAQAVLTKLGY